MRDDVDFCIEFIKQVQSNPCLYDNQDPFYANSRKNQLTWKKIGAKFNENALDCRRKWKIIRSSYMRSLHKRGGAKKDYYLSPHLHFLKPFMKRRVREPAADPDDSDDNPDDGDGSEAPTPESAHDDRVGAGGERDVGEDPIFVGVKKETGGGEDVAVERETGGGEEVAAEREPCEMYLLSLVPHVRSMDLRQQLQFQRGVLELIERIKYGG